MEIKIPNFLKNDDEEFSDESITDNTSKRQLQGSRIGGDKDSLDKSKRSTMKIVLIVLFIVVMAMLIIFFIRLHLINDDLTNISKINVDTPWGPERTTFTWNDPASYATFNSITNNPVLGDERDFVRIREINESGGSGSEVSLSPGGIYEVYIYYHNDADLEEIAEKAVGIADGVAIKSSFPQVLRAGERGVITGTIMASDTNPTSVWDGVYMTTDTDVRLEYIPDTAIIHNDGELDGNNIGSSYLFGDGALIGFNELSGLLPGGSQYAGYITYQLLVSEYLK